MSECFLDVYHLMEKVRLNHQSVITDCLEESKIDLCFQGSESKTLKLEKYNRSVL
jgi:hypothetical protein